MLVTGSDLARIVVSAQKTCRPCIIGNSSVYFMTGVKFIDETRAFKWPDVEGNEVWMTSGEAAKTELKREFPGLKRVGWRRDNIKLMDKRPPMYYGGPGEFEGVYVDIKGAYWSIYKDLWLDTRYPRGMGYLPLTGLAERLEHHKTVRNGVIGVITTRHTQMINKKGQKIQVKSRNNFLSPCLWGTIQDVLHDLAWLGVNVYGARYVNTDGYFFDHTGAGQDFAGLLLDLGFNLHVHTGPIHVIGWGAYSVHGFKHTLNYQKLANMKGNFKEWTNLGIPGGTIWWLNKLRNLPKRFKPTLPGL